MPVNGAGQQQQQQWQQLGGRSERSQHAAQQGAGLPGRVQGGAALERMHAEQQTQGTAKCRWKMLGTYRSRRPPPHHSDTCRGWPQHAHHAQCATHSMAGLTLSTQADLCTHSGPCTSIRGIIQLLRLRSCAVTHPPAHPTLASAAASPHMRTVRYLLPPFSTPSRWKK